LRQGAIAVQSWDWVGTIEAVCVSSQKGMVKHAVSDITLKKGWGIEGDAHAGDRHRQVSLLAGESIDRMREKLPGLGNPHRYRQQHNMGRFRNAHSFLSFYRPVLLMVQPSKKTGTVS